MTNLSKQTQSKLSSCQHTALISTVAIMLKGLGALGLRPWP